MAIEGCGDNEIPVAVIDDSGREMRIIGVRHRDSRVQIVVSTEGPGQ
ncbi:hypothetical protein [Nonomuraea diastatica]|nr:hypothetical protein [Nonomuraea diastatica]